MERKRQRWRVVGKKEEKDVEKKEEEGWREGKRKRVVEEEAVGF